MCGIFGQINNEPSTFNRIIFNTLGIANDTRGGDSCGIFIDGESEYGVDKNKLYEDFFLSSYLLKNIKQCRIAFGHCRKTSVGKTSLETAQPVVIKENNEVKFVLMHNGTIYNYEKLAKKYIPDVDIKGMTDSQVMARIFYYKGYDALSEYNGGAVFMIADYREDPDNPKVLVWKGESKQSKYQTTVFEERPFYYIKTKFGIIFSSIACYLEGFIHNTCWTIKSNCLIEISNGDLFIVKEYSRKNAQQIKELDSYKAKQNLIIHNILHTIFIITSMEIICLKAIKFMVRNFVALMVLVLMMFIILIKLNFSGFIMDCYYIMKNALIRLN